MLKEFKAFLMRGNIMELAIAFIMGAAFTAVVTSFTQGIVNPIIAAVAGKPSFDTVWHLGKGAIQIGVFLTAVINFLIIGAVVFAMMKLATTMMRPMSKPEEKPVAAQSDEVIVLTEIRELLRAK